MTSLHDSPIGQDLRLEVIDLEDATAFRMREMGLAPGAIVRVVQRGGFGGRVVAVNRQRFALDGATSMRLMCTTL